MANVWVVQRGNRVSFAAKTLAEVLGGNFDGYIPAQPRISRAIHLAHAARAECGGNFIGTKLCTWGERHKLARLYSRETFAWYPHRICVPHYPHSAFPSEHHRQLKPEAIQDEPIGNDKSANVYYSHRYFSDGSALIETRPQFCGEIRIFRQ